jgi:hypothetical protein
LDSAWFFAAALPFSAPVFFVVDGPLLVLLDHVGAIGYMSKEILTLRGKKYGSLIFNPVCSVFL